MSEKINVLANVLAEESVTILYDSTASTAGVDLDSRTVVFPVKQFPEDLETMLICHECSHIIWTPKEPWLEYIKKYPERKDILNVVEDARIDRLFIERYKGAAKIYNQASGELYKTDFFQIKNKTEFGFLENLNLSKKLRSYFKPKFINQTEVDLFIRLGKTQTFDESINLANDVWNYLKNDSNDSKEDEQQKTTVEIQIGATTLSLEELPEKDRQQLAKKLTTNSTTHIVIKDKPSTKMIRTDIGKIIQISSKGSSTFAKNLAKQFRIKKNAQDIAKTKIVNSGKLNTDLLSKYKFTDHLFLKNEIITQEQNHCLVFFIDLSGSMRDLVYPLKERLIDLVRFCKLSSIPFAVYGYGSQTVLIGSHKDKINQLLTRLDRLNMSVDGSTPTAETLFDICFDIKKFVRDTRKQKTTLIHMSDGQPDTVHINSTVRWSQGIYHLSDVTSPFGFIKKYCGLYKTMAFFYYNKSPGSIPEMIRNNTGKKSCGEYDRVFVLDSTNLSKYNSTLVTDIIDCIK